MPATFANYFNIGDYRYTEGLSGTVSVQVIDKTKSSYEDIPAIIDIGGGETYRVTDASNCFYNCSSLVQAPKIPDSVTDMSGCFVGCLSLVQAPKIPDGVTNMSWCFSVCSALVQAPEIPSNVTNIEFCFSECLSLVQAPEIPSSVTSMYGCFSECSALVQAPKIPNGVTNMDGCFSGCSALTQAPEIPSSVTSMYRCFGSCRSLAQAPEIPSNVTNIEFCFSECLSLVQAPKIPDGVTSMRNCFHDCVALVQAPKIPNGVTSMYGCFSGCSALTQAPEIPSSVTSMYRCFGSCRSLSGNITVANEPGLYSSLFLGTSEHIYIVPDRLSDEAIATWRNIAAEYPNVHYYTDDAALSITSLSATRVAEKSGVQESEEGNYAFVLASYTTGYIPEGVTRTLTWSAMRNGAALTPAVGWLGTDNERIKDDRIKVAWFAHPASLTGSYTVTVSDNLGNSASMEVTLPRAGALLDFHAGGDGLAVGTVSTGAGFVVAMESSFTEPVGMTDMQANVVTSGVVSGNVVSAAHASVGGCGVLYIDSSGKARISAGKGE